jgi:hypothetical protein
MIGYEGLTEATRVIAKGLANSIVNVHLPGRV